MTFEKFVFYCFAAMLLFAATMVVTRRNPVQSALFLVLTFFCTSAIWLLLEAEFLAITLVLVYVGAVMVLFLFVIMMLDVDVAAMRAGFVRYLPIGLLVAIAMVVQLVMVVGPQRFGLDKVAAPIRHAADYSNTEELGQLLYTVYMYPFEIAAFILLIAIVAAISLTLRRRKGVRHQDISKQVRVKRDDRVRLVSMQAEERDD
ncbi:MAG: NADH-quinone oxidoreductase subunit J [gamma proteobacterium symbiont of Bathyaustriella thionipta]|nr:NADH-quinone oxidoreductase subunit J [gamma proteobacterium symbiont of Bathyaustriella thionipta]